MSPCKPLHSEQGTTLVESVIMLTVMIPIFIAGLVLVYLAYSAFWIESMLYEGTICRIEDRPKHECEKEVFDRLQRLLPFSKIHSLSLNKTTSGAKGDIVYQINDAIHLRRHIDTQAPGM